MRKYDVCVKYDDFSDTTTPGHNSTNLEAEISCLYVVCLKSKCTDFLFNYLLDLPEITSYLLRSMTLGKLHSGSNVSSTDHSSTGSHFP